MRSVAAGQRVSWLTRRSTARIRRLRRGFRFASRGIATAPQRRLPLPLRQAVSKLCVQLLTGRSPRSMTYAMFLGEGIPRSVATGVPN